MYLIANNAGVAENHGGLCLKRMVQSCLALLLLFGALTTLVVMAANLVLPVLGAVCLKYGGETCWWASHQAVILFNVVFIFPLCLKVCVTMSRAFFACRLVFEIHLVVVVVGFTRKISMP